MAERIRSFEDLGPPVDRGKPAQAPEAAPTAGKERIQTVEDLGPPVDRSQPDTPQPDPQVPER